MTENKANPEQEKTPSENSVENKTDKPQKPETKKERFKIDEKDMIKIKYNF